MTELPREEALRRARIVTDRLLLDTAATADAIQQAYRDGVKAAAQRCVEIASNAVDAFTKLGEFERAIGAEVVVSAIDDQVVVRQLSTNVIRHEFALPEVTK